MWTCLHLECVCVFLLLKLCQDFILLAVSLLPHPTWMKPPSVTKNFSYIHLVLKVSCPLLILMKLYLIFYVGGDTFNTSVGLGTSRIPECDAGYSLPLSKSLEILMVSVLPVYHFISPVRISFSKDTCAKSPRVLAGVWLVFIFLAFITY